MEVNPTRLEFFRELRNGIRQQLLDSALKGYADSGGVHLPLDTSLLNKVRDDQLGYATRFNTSGDTIADPVRLGMYARQSARLGYITGQMQAMKERGAKYWRRVIHPELSKTGSCPICIADSKLVHPMDFMFTDHPNGQCSVEALAYSIGGDEIEMPIPGRPTLGEIARQVAAILKRPFEEVIRRFRK